VRGQSHKSPGWVPPCSGSREVPYLRRACGSCPGRAVWAWAAGWTWAAVWTWTYAFPAFVLLWLAPLLACLASPLAPTADAPSIRRLPILRIPPLFPPLQAANKLLCLFHVLLDFFHQLSQHLPFSARQQPFKAAVILRACRLLQPPPREAEISKAVEGVTVSSQPMNASSQAGK